MIHNMIPHCRLVLYLSLNSSVDGVAWSGSRRVDCVLWSTSMCVHNTIPQNVTVHAGIFYLPFNTTMDGVAWSDSRRVDCALCGCIHHIGYCWLAQSSYHSKPHVMLLNGKTYGVKQSSIIALRTKVSNIWNTSVTDASNR